MNLGFCRVLGEGLEGFGACALLWTSASRKEQPGRVWRLRLDPETYLVKDLYKEIIIRSPKKIGSSGSRIGFRACVWGIEVQAQRAFSMSYGSNDSS